MTDILTLIIFVGPIYVTTERIGNGWIITNVYYGKFEIYNDNNNLSIIVYKVVKLLDNPKLLP